MFFNSFHCDRNEIYFCFDLLTYYLCFEEITASADVFFRMISFRGTYITPIIRNEILFLSKQPQGNNNRYEFHFSLFHVNSFKRFTGYRIENISFRPKWQKQPPEVFYKKDVKIPPNSRKNTSAGVSLFNRVAVLQHVTLLERASDTGVSLQILWNFLEHVFTKHPLDCF